ncbi:glycosyltransferase family 4 protein [Lutibacter maritimus]|uniref:Glycosyltransferase involved in cell wall bisynthesis n=1 Tax=Lutibacter maritimus TaxID=593133 RepID=A0A1I6SD63_9FLAO|nr:glycosyltransferase family 4 protein [Lutibacter maritimus]SFS74688.1 Glycosyltransferase involved in cell wall bisynthesis [Lutibacter maritimus]
MRIGMILDKTFPPDPRVANEAISLIENGHEVFLFCLKYADELKNETINGIQVKRYKSNKFIYKSSALAYTIPIYSKLLVKKIYHFLVKNAIEVIHIHDIQIAEAVFTANKKLNLKTVQDLHENRPEIMKFYPHLQKFPGKFLISSIKWKAKEEEFIKKADAVVVVTEESKEEIVSRVGKDSQSIVVVPNTVHKSYFTKAEINQSIIEKYKHNFMLLYVGDTGLRRGLQTAIESVAVLKDKIPSIKLVIVGSNTSDIFLKQQAEDLDIEKYVDFEGWQNEKLFPSYILASSVCISPLHRNLHHDTTYANKIFQYMSFGKPLLVSDALSQKNIVEKANAGLVHKAENSIDFTEKVLELFYVKVLQTKFGESGKAFIENEFNWEKTSEKLIELYQNFNQ